MCSQIKRFISFLSLANIHMQFHYSFLVKLLLVVHVMLFCIFNAIQQKNKLYFFHCLVIYITWQSHELVEGLERCYIKWKVKIWYVTFLFLWQGKCLGFENTFERFLLCKVDLWNQVGTATPRFVGEGLKQLLEQNNEEKRSKQAKHGA